MPSGFVIKFLLTLAIGSCMLNGADELKVSLRQAAANAIRKADAWQCGTIDKHRLCLDTIQTHCLVLLARQTSAVEFGDDLVWISAGSLLRTAFTMGLHRDPTLLQDLSVYQIEMRRRLWATVLELNVQSSLDSGMPPLIGPGDYDCGPPSNINDDEISPDTATVHASSARADTVFTQTSCQRIVLRSLSIRLQVTRVLNGLGTDQKYDEALLLSQELASSCRFNSALFESLSRNRGASQQVDPPSRFQVMLVNLLTRRFFHSLHSPFANESLKDLKYYYSRRMQLESALELVSILATDFSESQMKTEDLHALNLIQVAGRGFLKCALIDASQTVCFELLQQLRESYLPSGLGVQMSVSQTELYQAVQSLVSVGKRRIEGGETNVKLYVFYSGVLAQADAILSGRDVCTSITSSARRTLHMSYEMLLCRAVKAGISLPCVGDGNTERCSPSGSSLPMLQDDLNMCDITADLPSYIDRWVDFCLEGMGGDFDVPEVGLLGGRDGSGSGYGGDS